MQCQPGPPKNKSIWGVDHKGKPFILPSIGGITLNIQVGDSAFGWAGDHIEPGVSCTCNTLKPLEHPNNSLQLYSCAGNIAKIISGKAEGKIGYVLGQHGGSEHIIVDFPKKVKKKLTYDDKIMIYAKGLGLKLTDYEDIILYSIDPDLLEQLNIKQLNKSEIEVPVTTFIPAACMGSGLGSPLPANGDYDIMTSDPKSVKKYNLDKIRFGDFVAILDHDNCYGRSYLQGAVTIGIVVHSDCMKAGHGPGVTTIMSCRTSNIKPIIDPSANIADILNIGTVLE